MSLARRHGCCSGSASCSTHGRRARRAHHRRARQGALRRPGRGDPRPGGRRVRLRRRRTCSRAASPRTPRPRSTCTRSASRSGPVGVISPFNFPAMVPMWFFPIAIAAGNTRDPQAEREGPVGGELWLAALWKRGRPARRACSTCCTATRSRWTRCSSTPTSRRSRSSARPRSRATCTRPAPAHGKRVQALGGAKNHMVVLPDADLDLAADAAVNAGFGSAGERCMAISALVAVGVDRRRPGRPDRRARWRTLRTGDGRRGCDMGPLVTARAPGQGRGAMSTPAWPPGASSSSTAANPTLDGDGRRVLARPDPVRPRHHRHDRSTPTRSSVRCCRWCGWTATTRRSTWSTATRTATAPRSSPTTAAPPAGSRTRSRSAWSGSTCRSRCRWPTTPSAAGRHSLFGDTHAHGTEGVHFFTRGKVVTTRWLDPSHGGLNLGFPQNA